MAVFTSLLLILFAEAVFLGRVLLPVDLIYAHDPVWRAVAPPGFTRAANPLQSDVVYQFYPWRVFAQQWLSQGIIPFWNPLILGGVSFVGNDQSALFYPVHLLGYLFSPAAGFTFSAIARLLIAGLATYAYLRVIGRGLPAAYVGAVAFMLGGWLIAWLNWPHVNVAVWLPAVLLCVDRVFHGGRLGWVGLLALAVGAQFLGGHIETTFHLGLVAAAYTIFLAARAWFAGAPGAGLRRFGLALLGAVLGFGIGAVQLVPFLDQLAKSGLVDERAAFSTGAAIWYYPHAWQNLLTLPTILWPTLLGSPIDPTYWAFEFLTNYNEYVLYGGTLTLVLAVTGAIGWRRDALTLFWLGVAVFSLGVAYRLPFFEAINHLPFFEVSLNGRLRMVFSFALAVLAAGGIDWLLPRLQTGNRTAGAGTFRAATGALILGAVALIIPLGIWAGLQVAEGPLLSIGREYVETQVIGRSELPHGLDYYLGRVRYFYDGTVARFAPPALPMYLPAASAFAFAAALWAARRGVLPRAVLAGLLPVALAAELLVFAAGLNPAIEPASVFPETPVTRFLQEQAGDERVAGVEFALMPNSGMIFGLHDLRGYEVIRPAAVWDLLRDVPGRRPFGDYLILSSPESRLLDLFSVRYLVVGPNEKLPPPDRFTPVFSAGGVGVYENTRTLPRASIVPGAEMVAAESIPARLAAGDFDPRQRVLLDTSLPAAGDAPARTGSARIVSEDPNRVTIETTLDGAGYLLLTDTYDPEWTATVNGEDTLLLRANGALRAVPLAAGTHLVEFVYQPLSVWTGAALSLIGVGLAASLVAFGVRRSPGR